MFKKIFSAVLFAIAIFSIGSPVNAERVYVGEFRGKSIEIETDSIKVDDERFYVHAYKYDSSDDDEGYVGSFIFIYLPKMDNFSWSFVNPRIAYFAGDGGLISMASDTVKEVFAICIKYLKD